MFIVEDPPAEVKRVWVMFIVEDPPVTMKCRTAIKAVSLCTNLSVILDSLSCSFTSISFLSKPCVDSVNEHNKLSTDTRWSKSWDFFYLCKFTKLYMGKF